MAMMMQGQMVFSKLMLGAKLAVHHGGEWAKVKKHSKFVEDQVVESEKITCSGLKVCKKKGGNEDDKDNEHNVDGVIKDLVDDAQVDGLVLTKSKVLKKHLCIFLLSLCILCS